MNETYTIPRGVPATMATLRGMRARLFALNIRGPYRLALTREQFRELEEDLFVLNQWWGTGRPWRVEDFELSILTELMPEPRTHRDRVAGVFGRTVDLLRYDELQVHRAQNWASLLDGSWAQVASPRPSPRTSHSYW